VTDAAARWPLFPPLARVSRSATNPAAREPLAPGFAFATNPATRQPRGPAHRARITVTA